MKRDETTAWVTQLFPGEPELLTATDSESDLNFAVFPLTEDGSDQVVCTIGAADIDSGMVTAGDAAVRSEIFIAGHKQDNKLLQVLGNVTKLLVDVAGQRTIQPGTMLPSAIADVWPEATTKHVALVVPWVWSNGVPRITEKATGELATPEEAEENPHSVERITTMLQVVPLTDAEFELATDPQAGGLGAVQQKLAEANADLLDLHRPSAV
ncbi:suppressor of fused domain protein [Corynebacterium ulceribovis]|uniref:suppressor of fused domain protein n=1 Tax=Corynebacterium ulceribovis TaxID=487732 RepID=UPI000381A508|nr:suppressor of fused domain protein [Corynebacterium ulceribovis]